MKFKEIITSPVGRKFVMGLTGIFLVLFLLVHATLNATIFLNDGGVFFDKAAHFMEYNWIIRILEIGLFIGFIIHIVQGLTLVSLNRKARPVKYKITRYTKRIKWYSRSMGILGSLILLYLVMHLAQFWVPKKEEIFFDGAQFNLYDRMREVFTNPLWFALYMVGLAALLFHLLHGTNSAFRSLGINDKAYTPLLEKIGAIYSIAIIILFALMPMSFMFGWID